ncbi:MAG: SDR family NAD(P)-dependent oxidoreductase [Vulcanimicrobiaceae bacterium]
MLITGAAQGIGRSIAAGFAHRGWKVVMGDIQEDKVGAAARDIGNAALAVKLDVCDEASAASAVQAAMDRFGRLDALLNNAALFTQLKRQSLTDISLSEWRRVVDVNLLGPFVMTKAVVEPMKRSGGGSIINIATVGIYHASNKLGHYNASKAGVVGLTRTAARELGEYGIRVNAIAPGATSTEEVQAVSSPERLAERAKLRSLARIQTPEDLFGPILFLASEESRFITGQLLNVDGGEFFH